MSPDLVFQITNPLALIGWILLLFAPLIPKWSDRIAGYAIPALLALIYAIMLVIHAGGGEGGFGSLAEVMSLFAVPGLVMAGWLHYPGSLVTALRGRDGVFAGSTVLR